MTRCQPRILGVVRAVERARYDDPDAAELWRTAQGNWLKGCRRLMRWLADENRLAPRGPIDSPLRSACRTRRPVRLLARQVLLSRDQQAAVRQPVQAVPGDLRDSQT